MPSHANGAPLKAYLARPAVGDGPWPGVVVIHDAFGLTVVAREHADRLAAAGYLALVPDLHTRGGFARCVRSTFAALTSGTGAAYGDLDLARPLAPWPGRLYRPPRRDRLLYGRQLRLDDRAAGVLRRRAELWSPAGGSLRARWVCPIVASYGAKDRSLEGVASHLAAALGERGVSHDVREYRSVGHGFMDRYDVGP